MRILLTTLNAKYIHSNLAIRLLYQLNKSFDGLEWKEFTIKESKVDIANYCSSYTVVAFSCYIWNITPTIAVIKELKKINPHITIVLGGPEVSYEWQEIIALPEVDYIIVGEGEIPFRQFIESFPNVTNVAGLVRKTTEGVVHNPAPVMFDLKELEHINPYSDDNVEELKNRVLYLETSRGCPYKCEFCLASLDNKVRYLPNDSIKATLLYLMKHGKVIKFLDRTFNVKKDFTLDIFKFILEHHHPDNVFQFEITADIVHPDIIKYINEHVPPNLFRFEIGIQTVNQKANLEVSRKQNFEKTKGVINALSSKIEMHLDLIVGLPLDYWDDIKYSFEEVFKLFAPELQLGFLKFLKGTPVRDKHNQHEFVFDPMPPYQIIESKYLSKVERTKIVDLENILEIYWNKKKAINTLKYVTSKYSVFDFFIELGNFFKLVSDFHKHSLEETYVILDKYANEYFPNDTVLKELIAIDYHVYHKVKPKNLFKEDLEQKAKYELLLNQNLNHHKNRYIVLPISFDFDEFLSSQTIKLGNYPLIIQYNGISKPEIVSPKNYNGLLEHSNLEH
ncbi:MAG: DUF4080 domain-containing protein [Bacteroidetes bacterium]|nr:DUF4080 domain-containing protein [Bacteroidota bacterium]